MNKKELNKKHEKEREELKRKHQEEMSDLFNGRKTMAEILNDIDKRNETS